MPFGKFVFHLGRINLGVCDKVVHTKQNTTEFVLYHFPAILDM